MEGRAVPSLSDLYHYRARITRVVDGDTVVADIDLGCGVWIRGERLRLYGVDAPEVRGVADPGPGHAAAAALEKLIRDAGADVLIRTHKDERGKFGRYLVELWPVEPAEGGPSFNERLIAQGYAVPYMEGRR